MQKLQIIQLDFFNGILGRNAFQGGLFCRGFLGRGFFERGFLRGRLLGGRLLYGFFLFWRGWRSWGLRITGLEKQGCYQQQ